MFACSRNLNIFSCYASYGTNTRVPDVSIFRINRRQPVVGEEGAVCILRTPAPWRSHAVLHKLCPGAAATVVAGGS